MKIIGHRGAKGLAPENTLASFKKALEHHVDEVELDVQITADGQVVVIHNLELIDASGNQLKIAGSTLAELRAHKPDLPLLEEAIELINRKVPLIVEVKPGVPVKPVVKVIKSFLKKGWTNSDFCLASRDQPILLELHRELPDISTMVIDFWSGVRAVRHAKQVGTKRIGMLEYWIWPGFVHAMRRGGYELLIAPPGTPQKERLFSCFGRAGYANQPARARRWERHGLAGVITDYPDRFESKKS
ncbi:MAG TPA: glycerophosphodiester phosphodiesterase [Candidatus Saccharimonadales bacterium]|nr:glycerophosphodiester phosphodiesterase [Candidatus Saccharimonadales bacterium]